MPHYSHSKIGKKLSLGSWGIECDSGKSQSDFIKVMSATDTNRALLCAVVDLLDDMVRGQQRVINAIGKIPEKAEKAKLKAEMALERAKQKTAAAELKVAEAAPPVVQVVQMGQDELEAVVDAGRVYRKF